MKWMIDKCEQCRYTRWCLGGLCSGCNSSLDVSA
jgi:rRNA maturation protein Nop10